MLFLYIQLENAQSMCRNIAVSITRTPKYISQSRVSVLVYRTQLYSKVDTILFYNIHEPIHVSFPLLLPTLLRGVSA